MLSKILPATNFHVLVWAKTFSALTESALVPFYDFTNIKNRYFIIKDIQFKFFTPGVKDLVWEVAYDNAIATVNANTRYSVTTINQMQLQDHLIGLNSSIKIKMLANGSPIGILDSSQYSIAALNYKDIFAFIPNKLQSDFEILITPNNNFKDVLGTSFFPAVYLEMTGFSLDENQLDNLKATDLQKVQIVQPKEVKSSGILKNPQPPDKPEFFYE